MPSTTSGSTRKAQVGLEAAASLATRPLNLNRRVVVTGIGLICGVGNTSEEVWRNLLAGKSGVARITDFDTSDFACQIAAEVKNFDPLKFIEKKELKKMGRFIHLALAAADEAMKHVAAGGHAGNRRARGRAHRLRHRRLRRHRARAHRRCCKAARARSRPSSSPPPSSIWRPGTSASATAPRGRTRPRPRPAPPARTPSATASRSSRAAMPT